jgi:hypothetical protein
MPYRIMLMRLSAALTVVAFLAAVSVPVSAQVKTQPAQKIPVQPAQPAQPPQRTIVNIGGTYGPDGCDIDGQHYIIGEVKNVVVTQGGGKPKTVAMTCTSRGWDDGGK